MALVFEPLRLPLSTDDQGEVRVKGTRVPLQYLVYDYRNGATAEDIVSNYPALNLADVYAVLSFYLAHQAEVDAYVQERATAAQGLKQVIEAHFPQKGIRDRLRVRLEQK
jgi:uncharacterized protein (DUF433 family)